jgi:hypothetical protein
MENVRYTEDQYYDVEVGMHWGWFFTSLFFGPFMFFILLIRNYAPERHMRRFKSVCYGWLVWIALWIAMYFLLFASIFAAVMGTVGEGGVEI